MQQALDVVLNVGRFALLVIAVCVAFMLLVSIIDGHSRRRSARHKQDHEQSTSDHDPDQK